MTEEKLQEWVKYLNERKGDLKGYDCPICNNEGFYYFANNGEVGISPCSCMRIRRSKAGMTMESYKTDEPWQKAVKSRAEDYLQKRRGWFFVGGQVGAGKTHICRAILTELSKKRQIEVMYWISDSRRLKSLANSTDYQQAIEQYKNAEVLLIDDLFFGSVTEADKLLARYIIDARYSKSLITIINSEKTLDDITVLDEGTAGRIRERAGQYVLSLHKDIRKDMRR